MNKKKLPLQLVDDLSKLKLDPIEIYFSNERKGRFTLLVKNIDSLQVLKWNKTHGFNEHFIKLNKEINFYRKNKNEQFLPKLIYYENHFLLIEHFDSNNLRKWIIEYISSKKKFENAKGINVEFKKVIENYFVALSSLKKLGIASKEKKINIERYVTRYFSKLFKSGPMNTSRPPIEERLSRSYFFVFYPLLKKRAGKIEKKINENNLTLSKGIIHGDLHLNNILVQKEKADIKIIDWENISYNYTLFDLCYSFVMLYFLLYGFEEHQRYLFTKFKTYVKKNYPVEREIIFEILNLYYNAILTNRKFGNYNLSFLHFIKYIFLLPFNISHFKN